MPWKSATKPAPDRLAHIAPLSEFPPEKRELIEAAVMQPRPPERWLLYGAPGDPHPLAKMESRAWYEWHWERGIDPDKKRQPLDRGLRRLVIERDGYVCGLCGGAVEPSDVHIDHILPVALGGLDRSDNLQVAHSRCNTRKGARV